MSDKWEDAEEWEDSPSNAELGGLIERAPKPSKVAEKSPDFLNFLMGAPRKGQEQGMVSKQARSGIGLAEPIISLGTSMGAQAMAVPRLINNARDPNYVPSDRGALDDAFRQSGEDYTYQPRTELGQTINDDVIAPLMQQVGVPLMGVAHAPVQGSSRLGRGGAGIPKETLVEAPRALPEPSSKLEKLKALTEESKWEDAPAPKNAIDPIQAIVDQQLEGWNEPLRPPAKTGIDTITQQLEASRHADAQRVLEERQAALEEQVRRQAALDQGAAERARQEAAPTGFAEHQEALRRDAETRQRGDNTPMEFTPTEAPYGLADTPYQPKGGIDPGVDLIGGINKQRGAIDVQGIIEGLKGLNEGHLSPSEYLARFKGTFNEKEMRNAERVLNDPNSTHKIVFMSPEEFHNIAEKRGSDFQSSTGRRESIREGLKSKEGLDDIPYLKGVVQDGEFKVTAHNGRHRMDVFQEQGIQAVPVRISAVDVKAIMQGKNGDVHLPDTIQTQNGTTTSFSGMSRKQRGAVDFSFGDKRARELIAEENRDAKKMMEMANSARQYADYKFLAEDAGKFFDNNKFLFEKLNKLKELSPWIPDQQLSHDASLSFSRLEAAFDHFKKAIDNPEEVGREVQNVKFLLNEMDHIDIQQKYLEAVSEYRDGLNMRSKNERTMAKSIDEAIGNVSQIRNSSGNKQRGAVDLGSPEPKPGNKVSTYTKDSPEVVAAKAALLADRKRELMNIDAYRTNIDTPEKVIALAPDAKDLGPTQAFKARTVSPGMNAVAISSNNPLLRYTRDAISKTVRAAEQYTRQYVTGPDGFGAKMKALSKEELNEVVGALQHADRKQRDLMPEALKEAGYSDKQIALIDHVNKMDQAKLDLWNKVRTELGLPVVTKRAGHFAGNFSGDYKTLVYNKEKEVVGVIGTNTSWSNKMIQKKVLEKDPTLTFADTKRTALGGSGAKAVRFGGLEDLVGLLAKDDPRFAKIQEIVDAAIKERGDSLYGASLHDKAKKGVWGNEGNKFWEDRDANTKQALKAFVDYWEDGIASHLNLPTEVKLKELMDNPALDHMPRAKQYVNDYINNFTGRNLGTLGDGINKILDAPFRYLGLGSSVPRAAITQFNKRASQMTMGFVNIPFMITQYLQVGQMGLPELMKVRDSLGMGPVDFTNATGKAMSDGLKIAHEKLTGKPANLDPFAKESYQFAKDNGLLEFSEFTNARHIFQGKISKGFDKVMDDLPVIGRTDTEAATRPYVFFAAANMLKDSGMSQHEVFNTALNLTNHAMVNYHAAEKPLMYSKLGALGQSAGALQTFNHAFLGQLGTFMKEAAKGRPGPLAAATVMMLSLAGLKGVPFYETADEMVKSITDKFFHKRSSIADIALAHSPQFMKNHPWTEDAVGSGALSTATGVNMQSRLSAANVLPQAEKGVLSAVGQAVSPFGSYGVQVGKGVLDLATNRDALAAKNLAVTLAPSGTAKGLVENALKMNDKNQTINKRGEVDYQRTPFDTAVKKYSGATSLEESINKDRLYTQQTNQKSRQDAQKAITEEAKRMIAQRTLTKEALQEFAKKYVQESGDPQQLVNSLVQYAQEVNRTTKQRLEGIPNNSISGVKKYENYNPK